MVITLKIDENIRNMDAIHQYIRDSGRFRFSNLNEPMRLHFFALSIQKKIYNLKLFRNEGELDEVWVKQTNIYESHGGIAHTPSLRRQNTSLL